MDPLSYIARSEQELVELTSELVAVATENPPGAEYRRCSALLGEMLAARGLPVEELGGAGCLRSFVGEGRRTLYFHGHYDVVPAQRMEQFLPEVREGALHGRGSADMKGGVAAMIVAAAAIQQARTSLDGRIGLVFVPDEETGGAGGSGWLAGRGLLGEGGIGMLSPEPTGGVVWNSHKGALSVRVTVHGKSAHVGLRHEGVNAFERMLDVAQALRRYDPELRLGGQASSGSNFNVVPERCSFTIDRRFDPEDGLEDAKSRLFAFFEDMRRNGIPLDVEVLQQAQAAGVPADTNLGTALSRAVEAVEGRPPRFGPCPGLLEIRFYARAGIPAYCYGPGRLELSHGPDERVEIDSLRRCAEVYTRVALDLLG